MKKSFLIGLITMLMMGLILAACGSSPPPRSVQQSSRPAPKWAGIVLTGENEPLLEGTTWKSVLYAEIGSTYEFRADGKMVVRIQYDGSTHSNCTWSREENTIKVIMWDGSTLFEARYYPQTQRIMGTYTYSNSSSPDEDTWEIQQGSSVASRPAAPSSTTNVYVQPSTPAQSSTPTPTPSAPTFQTGTYAWSNSGQNMTMQFSVGMVFAQFNNRQIWRGTYSINGTQLVISVTSAISDYSRLQGMTYSYTITSNTSFSGSGETWVRTGY